MSYRSSSRNSNKKYKKQSGGSIPLDELGANVADVLNEATTASNVGATNETEQETIPPPTTKSTQTANANSKSAQTANSNSKSAQTANTNTENTQHANSASTKIYSDEHTTEYKSEKAKEEDINTILAKINKQIKIWKASNEFQSDSDPKSKLIVDNEEYSVECVINAFYLKHSNEDACGFEKFIGSDKMIELNKVIPIEHLPENFEDSNKKYYNLHNFGIMLVEHIIESDKYKNADDDNKENVLKNIHHFIHQTIKYLQKHMDKFNVIDEKLLSSSYELLYLLNKLTLKRADVQGVDYTDLNTLYERVIVAIKDNISIYNQIKPDNFEATQSASKISETDAKQLEELKLTLEKKLTELESQKKSLDKNVKIINEKNASLNNISDRVKKIGREFN